MVKGSELQTPERGMDVQTRTHSNRATEDQESVAMDDLLAMRKRLEAAKVELVTHGRVPCADCYRRGWRAALQAVEGKG